VLDLDHQVADVGVADVQLHLDGLEGERVRHADGTGGAIVVVVRDGDIGSVFILVDLPPFYSQWEGPAGLKQLVVTPLTP
jgi:hypothetical protein